MSLKTQFRVAAILEFYAILSELYGFYYILW